MWYINDMLTLKVYVLHVLLSSLNFSDRIFTCSRCFYNIAKIYNAYFVYVRMYQGWIQGGHKSLETPYQEVPKTYVFI